MTRSDRMWHPEVEHNLSYLGVLGPKNFTSGDIDTIILDLPDEFQEVFDVQYRNPLEEEFYTMLGNNWVDLIHERADLWQIWDARFKAVAEVFLMDVYRGNIESELQQATTQGAARVPAHTSIASVPNVEEDETRKSPRIVVLTGAGISAESGLSTFRDANGLWEQHRIEDVASPVAFANDPDIVHRFYDARRAQLDEVQPNAAHWALSRLEAVFPGEVLIITQNVDDLHEAARSEHVLHMHGRLKSALCTACGAQEEHSGDLIKRPACTTCGERALRPDIVWFGEQVREGERIFEAVKNCEIFAVIGTSGTVYPAAELVHIAADNDAHTVLIDLDVDAHEDVYDLVCAGLATEMVPQWVREVMLRRGFKVSSNYLHLSEELIEDIEEFLSSKRGRRSSQKYDGIFSQSLLDLFTYLDLSVGQAEQHYASYLLDPVIQKLQIRDYGGDVGEFPDKAFYVHALSSSEVIVPIEEQLERTRIEHVADLLAWLIADIGVNEQLHTTGNSVGPLLTKWLSYVGSDLRSRGHDYLARRLTGVIRSRCSRGEVSDELAEILQLGMDLGLFTAFRAERNRLIAEFVKRNATGSHEERVLDMIEELLTAQEKFINYKREGNTNGMREEQRIFSKAMRTFQGLEIQWMRVMELMDSIGRLEATQPI